MTADEIRESTNWGTLTQENEGVINVLIEIAAQMAELNLMLKRLASGKEEFAVIATIQHP